MISDIIPQEERKKNKINQFVSINSKKNNHQNKSKLVTRYKEDDYQKYIAYSRHCYLYT